jgi:phosphoglycerate dehydrogenase-like enzyme
VDVSDPEPLPSDDPLWTAPNVLISPHFAGSGSPRSVQRLAEGVMENLRRFMAKEPPLHVVSAG